MTLREKLLIAGIALLAILLALGFRAWLDQRDARMKADSVASAQLVVINQAKQDRAAKEADKAQVVADLQKRLDTLEQQKREPMTAPQFVVDLNKLLPNLPQPVTTVVRDQGSGVSGQKPAETMIQIPAADLPDLRNYKLNCDETGAKLDACGRQAALQDAQLKDAKTEIDALVKERDAYKAASKGGSFLRRLKKDAICIAVSTGARIWAREITTQDAARRSERSPAAWSASCFEKRSK